MRGIEGVEGIKGIEGIKGMKGDGAGGGAQLTSRLHGADILEKQQ